MQCISLYHCLFAASLDRERVLCYNRGIRKKELRMRFDYTIEGTVLKKYNAPILG